MSVASMVPTLKSETDFVEQLIATTHAIVLFMDPEGRVLLYNDYMRDLCGYELDEVRGQDWFDRFIIPEDRQRLRGLYHAALDNMEVHANVNAIVTKSGELRQIEWWGNTVHGDEGKPLGLLSVGNDITEKLEMRRKLAESERLASIGLMAAVFAHEVGNPLNAIYLQLQLLMRRIDRPERGPLAPRVECILAEIQRLNHLLEDFRAYRNPSEIMLELTDVGEIVQDVSTLLSYRAADRDVRINCEVDNAIPQVLGNADKLKQVLINLCKNGIEAMAEGGVLRIRAWADPDKVEIEIVDQGPGIPDDIDVFTPFTTTKSSGMGLGLPLAREIVAAHSGQLRYRSELGQGTTFTLSLPRVAKAAAQQL